MFFKSLLNPERSLLWTVFHVALAIACTITPFIFIIWFYVILITNIGNALFQLKRGQYYGFVSLLFYLVSFEMLGRATRANPFVPFEVGKYFLISFMLLGLILKGVRSRKGLLMVLLLIPAMFYDLSDKRTFSDIVFNAFGSLSTALGIALLYKAPVTHFQINQILHLIWYTSLAVLFFTVIKTPDFSDIQFGLHAQFAAAADAAANQVSTILGLGMFLSFYSIINRLKFSGSYLGDFGILLLFTFQGLLTFSRGGILIATVVMAFLFFFYIWKKNKISKSQIFIGILSVIIGMYFIFKVVNEVSKGNLLLRYKGETQGTLLGRKNKSADVMFSGRFTILQDDLELWLKNSLTGVGAGSSQYMRERTKNVSPHIEFSRLLSEHGFAGLLYIILLFFLYNNLFYSFKNQAGKGLNIAFFVFALLTTFHSASRTYLSPTFFNLASLHVISGKNKSFLNKNKASIFP